MKDLLGREIQVGNYICYALTAGRSANLGVYIVREVQEEKIKAIKIESSYGHWDDSFKYKKWDKKPGEFVEMTPEEKFKVDNKTSTLSMPERVFILDGFDARLFEKSIDNNANR